MSLFKKMPSKSPIRPAKASKFTYEEKVLSKIEGIPVEFAVSPDSSKVAYILDRVNCWQVVVNGKSSEKWSGIKKGCLVFSPDSNHILYAAERNGDPLVVVDNRVLRGYGEVTSKPVFSADSKHHAFVTRWGRGQRLVVDGQTGQLCEGIGENDPVFSPSCERIAYTTFSSQGSAVAIADVQRPASVVQGPLFDGIARGTPIFSPDGKRIAYIAGKGGKFLAVVDERSSPLYDGIANGSLCFSPDSKHCAYVGCMAGKSQFVLDGRVVAEHDDVWLLQFGESETGYSYLAKSEGRWKWIVNGTQKAELCGGDEIVVAKNLSRIAYVYAQNDQQVLMVNETEAVKYSEILALVFSADASRLACVARDRVTKQGAVVIDGEFGPEFRRILRPGIFFSPDSKHVLYVAELPNGEEALVVDHEVITSFYKVCGDAKPYFPDSTSVRLVVVKKGGMVAQIHVRID